MSKNPEYLSNKELVDRLELHSLCCTKTEYREKLKTEILRRLEEPWRKLQGNHIKESSLFKLLEGIKKNKND